MISQKDIEKALDFLRDSAEAAAVNRSNRVYMEEFRKSLKAQLMSDNIDMACLLYTSPSPRDGLLSRMPSSA